MKNLAMFVPLAKADASQRLVYGVFNETPDAAREVFDYVSSKPLFKAWSEKLEKASDGKSLGNIRAQHNPKIAAGKLVSIDFDDLNKTISFCAKIVDDDEWNKVEEGVYTGFSPGGRYVKRWKAGGYTRYTAQPAELSIVDVPCNADATFTMVKADGSEEQVEFVLDKAYEPGNEATKERAGELAKAVGPDALAKNYVAQARAELIAEQARAALEKAAAQSDDEDDETETDQDDRLVEKVDPVAAAEDALAKARDALAKARAEAQVDQTEADTGPFADLAKAGAALILIGEHVQADEELAKSLYTVESTACMLQRIGSIMQSIAWEEKAENDVSSPLPQMALDILTRTKDMLVAMANEEIAELIAGTAKDMAGFSLNFATGNDTVTKAIAEEMIDLVKADAAVLEKAGARNSRSDLSKIQGMHDHSVALGATCDCEVTKAEELTEENDRLTKALDTMTPKISELADSIDAMAKASAADRETIAELRGKLEKLAAAPDLTKGIRIAGSKEGDGHGDELKKDGADQPKGFHAKLQKERDPVKRAQLVLARANGRPID